MEPEKFIIYNVRLGGWVTSSGATSQWTKAAEYTLKDAIAYCAVRFNDEPSCFPVSIEYVKEIKNAAR